MAKNSSASLKWKNFINKLTGKKAFSTAQLELFNDAQIADVLLADNITAIQSESKEIPYIIVGDNGDSLVAFAGSPLQEEGKRTYFNTRAEDFGEIGSDWNFDYSMPVNLPLSALKSHVTVLSEKSMNNLVRMLEVYRNAGNDAFKINGYTVSYRFGDIIEYLDDFYVINSVKNSEIHAYKLSEEQKRNSFRLFVRRIPMYVDLYHNDLIEYPNQIRLIAILPKKNSGSLYSYLGRREFYPNDIVQIDQELYLVKKTEKEQFYACPIDLEAIGTEEKTLEYGGKTYYIHDRRTLSFSGYKRDIVVGKYRTEAPAEEKKPKENKENKGNAEKKPQKRNKKRHYRKKDTAEA